MGMIMPSLWVGAAAGMGKSMQEMGAEAIKSGNEERRLAMAHAADMEKEKRINEAQDKRLGTVHKWEVEGKVQDRANAKIDEADKFALTNSPERIAAQASAVNQLSKLTLPQQMDELRQKEAITYHAPVDFSAGTRDLDTQLAQAKLADFTSPDAAAARAQAYKDATGSGHLNESQKASIKLLQEKIDNDEKENQRLIIARAGAENEAQQKAIDDAIGVNKLSINKNYLKAEGIINVANPATTKEITNPAGIEDKAKEEIKKGMIAPPAIKKNALTDAEEVSQLSEELSKNYGVDTKGKSLDQLKRIKFGITNPGMPFRNKD